MCCLFFQVHHANVFDLRPFKTHVPYITQLAISIYGYDDSEHLRSFIFYCGNCIIIFVKISWEYIARKSSITVMTVSLFKNNLFIFFFYFIIFCHNPICCNKFWPEIALYIILGSHILFKKLSFLRRSGIQVQIDCFEKIHSRQLFFIYGVFVLFWF